METYPILCTLKIIQLVPWNPDINNCLDGNCDGLEKMKHFRLKDYTSNCNYNLVLVTIVYVFSNKMIMMKMKYTY